MTPEEIEKKLMSYPEQAWVAAMKEHHARTGGYRPEDLRRLLGDPNQGVEVGANVSIAKSFNLHP